MRKFGYVWKALVTCNAHVECESIVSLCSEVITNTVVLGENRSKVKVTMSKLFVTNYLDIEIKKTYA